MYVYRSIYSKYPLTLAIQPPSPPPPLLRSEVNQPKIVMFFIFLILPLEIQKNEIF